MATFSYTATKNNKTYRGKIESSDKDTAFSSLSKQGLKPVSITETSAKKSTKRGKVRLKDLVVFTRQLSTMISAGVPITRAFNTLQNQTENKYFKYVIGSLAKDIESGIALNDALAKYPNVFSDVYVNMVKAGEAGGILDEILARLAAQVEKDASIRKKIKSASAYPIAIMGITVVAFFGIMLFVMPKLGKILTDLGGPDAKLPPYTVVMLSMSHVMQKYAIPIFIVMGIGIFLFRRYIKTPKGKYNFHKFLLKIPVLKMVIAKIAVARFARTFASLMASGVSVLDALQVTGGAVGNKVIEADLVAAAKNVKNGRPLSESIAKSKYFPPIVSQMLAIGEETGEIDTILVKVADFYDEEVDAVIDGLSSLIEPIMIVVLGGMVGMIAASVMGPIASLSQNAGNGGN